MERAELLLLKMLEQLRRNESKAQLLQSLRLLEQEIERSEEFSLATAVPFVPFIAPPVEAPLPVAEEEKVFELLQISEEDIERELEELKEAAEIREEMSIRVRPQIASADEADPDEPVDLPAGEPVPPVVVVSRNLTPPPAAALLHLADAPEPEPAPTPQAATVIVTRSEPIRNEENSPELNEKWKAPTGADVVQRFLETPIRDLKKAIGINDRYQFIQELFRGDEIMYERSIKTLNDFSIYPEAEFWVRRELKTKLAWDSEHPLVQQFDQLVRRRFS